MDWNRIEGDWKQMSGKVKQQWGDLTDNEITSVKGKRDELVGVLQQRYGYAKNKAREEVDRWAESLDSGLATVKDFAGRVTESSRKAGEGLADVSGNFDKAVRESAKDQPIATLMVAAFVGFALGAIWKS